MMYVGGRVDGNYLSLTIVKIKTIYATALEYRFNGDKKSLFLFLFFSMDSVGTAGYATDHRIILI